MFPTAPAAEASPSERVSHLTANVNGDADDHGGNGDAGDEGDADWSSDQGAQLPQNLLLPAPRLLPPERAARWAVGREQRGRQRERETSGKSKNLEPVQSVKREVAVPEVVQVGDLLHAQPAELTAADGAGHVIAAPVVHLDDVGTAARARLDVVG